MLHNTNILVIVIGFLKFQKMLIPFKKNSLEKKKEIDSLITTMNF